MPDLADEARVREALAYIDPIARRLHWQLGGKLDLDELRSMGHFAIFDLVRRYDPALAPFEPYMRQRLRWAMLDGVRRHTHGRALAARAWALAGSDEHGAARNEERRRQGAASSGPLSEVGYAARMQEILREHATAMGFRLVAARGGEAAIAPSSANPERATLTQFAYETLRGVVSSLEDERQRTIVERHYFQGEPFQDIARSMGLSPAWVSRLHTQAIAVLEKRLRARGVSSKR
ncbi:MAG: sigma-70 family RNA polymerase sigma factor [Myxococcales bacterium]|nr:sigma-70 family RNA polymerase sigma factor [Myxococcales bacterium]